MNRRSSRKRSYASPLREDQVKATRARILEGLLAMTAGGGELSIPELSRTTRVSVPTIYRYFPTRTDLLAAIVDYADSQVPWSNVPLDPDNLAPFMRAFFEHRAAVMDKLGAIGTLGSTSALWEVRRAVTVPRRRASVDEILAKVAPDLEEPRRTWLSDILVVLISQTMALAFREYVGCSPAMTAERVTWMIDTLIADANRPKDKTRRRRP